MPALLYEIRLGERSLRKSWGFSVVAVAILALGIGATTTIFSIANAMLWRPLNGGASGDLVRLYSASREPGEGYRRFSYPNFRDIQTHREIFEDVAAYSLDFVGVREGETTRRVFGAFVSANYFSLLRVSMARGRAFTPADERPGAPPVVVISHAYWTQTGADPDIIGKTLTLNATLCTIVGVAPENFTGTMAVTAPPVFVPLGVRAAVPSSRREFRPGRGGPGASLLDRNQHQFGVVGRLAPGLTIASAGPRLDALSRQLEADHPAENAKQALLVRPLPRIGDSGSPQRTDPFAVAMTFVLAMAVVLLLVAALNLANMMLARGSLRQRDIATRLALGASRWSIVRQLLLEASLLSLAGGVLGMWLAYGASRILASTLTPLLPMLVIVFDPSPDGLVLGATLGAAVLGTLVFGVAPAVQLARADVITALKAQSLNTTRDRGRGFWRHGLVVAQIALSLTLLAAGGLFFAGALRAADADPGFSLDRGLVVSVDPSLAGYDQPRARAAYARVLERLRARADLASASLASTVPYGESSFDQDVQPAGAAPTASGANATFRIVGADYFRTLGIPVVRGREFTLAEESGASPARPAIVDVLLAERLWPGQDAIGQRLQFRQPARGGATPATYEVVGVVASIASRLFETTRKPHMFVPFGGRDESAMTIHVRSAGGDSGVSEALIASIRDEISAVDATLPIVAVNTLRAHRDTGFEVWFVRLTARLFAIFGIVALVVATVGTYGVRAVTVGRRTREFGIRIALGATTADVTRMVMSEGARVVAVGLAIGLLLSTAVARLLSGWVYGLRTFEPLVFGVTSLLLVLAMLAACYVPARRATTIQPATALRNE